MEALIISGNSTKDIHLLPDIAKKMGLAVKFVKEDDLEDFGLTKAIIEGSPDELTDNKEFLKSLNN
jgi:hypothetical protein